MARPWAAFTQGGITTTSPEILKTTSILGSAETSTCYTWGDEVTQTQVEIAETLLFGREEEVVKAWELASGKSPSGKPYFEDWQLELLREVADCNVRKLIPFKWGNAPSTPSGQYDKVADITMPSTSIPEDTGLVTDIDDLGQLDIKGRRTGLVLALNALQAGLTALQRLKLIPPRMRQIGCHLLKTDQGKYAVRKYAGNRLRVLDFEEYATFTYRDAGKAKPFDTTQQALITGMLGSRIRRSWCAIEGYDWQDYSAVGSEVLRMTSGVGEIKVTNPLVVDTIYGKLFDQAMAGHSWSFRFDPDDRASIEDQFYYNLEVALFAELYKGTTEMAQLVASGRTYYAQMWGHWQLVLPPQIPDVGGLAQPYLPVASTMLEDDIPFVGVVRDDANSKLVIQTQLSRVKQALEVRTIEMGRTPGKKLDPMKEYWFQDHVVDDGYWWEEEVLTGFIIHFQMPYRHLTPNKLTVEQRRRLWFLRQFEVQNAGFKNWYLMRPGLGMVNGSVATVRITSRYEIEIVKQSDSDQNKTPQTPTGTGQTSGVPAQVPPPNEQTAALAAASNPAPAAPRTEPVQKPPTTP